MPRRFVVSFALAALSGCASERYTYAPVQTTSAEIAGEPAAVYAVPPESPRGDVRVATFGIAPLRPEGIEDSTLRAIHVALVVSNRSNEVWTVDGGEQQLTLAGWSPVGATTVKVTRPPQTEIPARSTRWIDLFFPLPSGVDHAREIPAFDVMWTVHVGPRAVTARTPFDRFLVEPAPRRLPDLREPERIPGTEPPLPGSEPPDRWPPPGR
jgi:hypothetical protein